MCEAAISNCAVWNGSILKVMFFPLLLSSSTISSGRFSASILTCLGCELLKLFISLISIRFFKVLGYRSTLPKKNYRLWSDTSYSSHVIAFDVEKFFDKKSGRMTTTVRVGIVSSITLAVTGVTECPFS